MLSYNCYLGYNRPTPIRWQSWLCGNMKHVRLGEKIWNWSCIVYCKHTDSSIEKEKHSTLMQE